MRLEESPTGPAYDVSQYQNSHLCLRGLLVIAEQAVVNQEHDIVPLVTIQIENVTLTRFESCAFLPLIVEVFFKDLEMQDALPLFAFFVKGKEFQEVPSAVNAEEIKFAIVIEVTPIDCSMLDLRKIGQVARFDLQLKSPSAFSHDLKGAVPENQQGMGVSG